MRKHFWVLAAGSVVFGFCILRSTHERNLSGDLAGAFENSANALEALQWLGAYVIYAFVVLGHGLLGNPRNLRSPAEVRPPA